MVFLKGCCAFLISRLIRNALTNLSTQSSSFSGTSISYRTLNGFKFSTDYISTVYFENGSTFGVTCASVCGGKNQNSRKKGCLHTSLVALQAMRNLKRFNDIFLSFQLILLQNM